MRWITGGCYRRLSATGPSPSTTSASTPVVVSSSTAFIVVVIVIVIVVVVIVVVIVIVITPTAASVAIVVVIVIVITSTAASVAIVVIVSVAPPLIAIAVVVALIAVVVSAASALSPAGTPARLDLDGLGSHRRMPVGREDQDVSSSGAADGDVGELGSAAGIGELRPGPRNNSVSRCHGDCNRHAIPRDIDTGGILDLDHRLAPEPGAGSHRRGWLPGQGQPVGALRERHG